MKAQKAQKAQKGVIRAEYGKTYRDGVILFKNGKGIRLRCTGLCVEKDRALFFDGKDLMGVVILAEVKACFFADFDNDSIKELCESFKDYGNAEE